LPPLVDASELFFAPASLVPSARLVFTFSAAVATFLPPLYVFVELVTIDSRAPRYIVGLVRLFFELATFLSFLIAGHDGSDSRISFSLHYEYYRAKRKIGTESPVPKRGRKESSIPSVALDAVGSGTSP
jgi:hypothetical protein